MEQALGDFGLVIVGRWQIGETRRHSGRRWVVVQRVLSVEAEEVQQGGIDRSVHVVLQPIVNQKIDLVIYFEKRSTYGIWHERFPFS